MVLEKRDKNERTPRFGGRGAALGLAKGDFDTTDSGCVDGGGGGAFEAGGGEVVLLGGLSEDVRPEKKEPKPPRRPGEVTVVGLVGALPLPFVVALEDDWGAASCNLVSFIVGVLPDAPRKKLDSLFGRAGCGAEAGAEVDSLALLLAFGSEGCLFRAPAS